MERIFTRLKHLCRRYLILIFEDCHQSWKDITITIIVPSEKSRYVFLYLISGEEKKTRRTCHRIRHPPTNGQYVVTTPTPKNTLTNFIEGGRKSRPLSTPPIVTQITDESRIILQEISLERVKKLTGALSGASNRVARKGGMAKERKKERKEKEIQSKACIGVIQRGTVAAGRAGFTLVDYRYRWPDACSLGGARGL